MIRVNRETDYGIVTLSLLAQAHPRRWSAADIARWRGLPRPTVSKILKILVHAGIVVSYRGAKGGYGLARLPEAITVAEIITSLEGPIALTQCVEDGRDACPYGSTCTVSGNWHRINRVVRDALEGVSLAEISDASGAAPVFPVDFTGARYVGNH